METAPTGFLLNATPLGELGDLTRNEKWWRDHQPWLAEKGYALRPRYQSDWQPSWGETDPDPLAHEDLAALRHGYIMDAVRSNDDTLVVLKRVGKEKHPYEVEISKYFSSDPVRSEPRNHAVPIFDVLEVPDDSDITIIVMPLLRQLDDPPFRTVGETVAFFQQIFEGLLFMHEHHVAHRDCMDLNVLYDPRPLYPRMFHPRHVYKTRDFKSRAKHRSRTARPVRYYFIDFGLSRKYNPEDGPPLEHPIRGGDKSVPEFLRSAEPCDPFPTDVYYLGSLIRMTFLEKIQGTEFMAPLVTLMVDDDPAKRPTMREVVDRFDIMVKGMPWWRLRSRLVRRREDVVYRTFRSIGHAVRTAVHILTWKAAIPLPR